jgi:ipoprotein LpqH
VSAAGAVSLLVGIVGCSSPSDALSIPGAHVVINGQGVDLQVRCEQASRLWTIETLEKEPGITATVETGDVVTAKAVDIRNVGGFTGTYWEGGIGKAEARVSQGRFTINGEAQGSFADKPNHRVTATFDVTSDC